jgi:hypothetical protein
MRFWILYRKWVAVFSILTVLSCDTENNVDPVFENYFIKYYGGDGEQEGRDFVVNPDGTMILVGISSINQRSKVFIVKVDPNGNELVRLMYDSLTSENEIAMDIEPTSAGDYVVLSNVMKNETEYYIRLRRIDSNLNVIFKDSINRSGSYFGYTITSVPDNKFLLSGTTTEVELPDPPNNLNEDLFTIELNADFTFEPDDLIRDGNSRSGAYIRSGRFSGSRTYFAGYTDELYDENDVEQNYEENFVFRSNVINPVTNKYDGTTRITRFAGTPESSERMISIAQLSSDGPFVAIGTQTDRNGSTSSRRLYAAAVSKDFTTITRQGILDNTVAEAVAITPSGDMNFLVLFNSVNDAGNRNIHLMKITSSLDENSQTFPRIAFGSPNNDDTGSAVAELPNGDIAILGTMNLTNQKKMALIKIRANGQF